MTKKRKIITTTEADPRVAEAVSIVRDMFRSFPRPSGSKKRVGISKQAKVLPIYP